MYPPLAQACSSYPIQNSQFSPCPTRLTCPTRPTSPNPPNPPSLLNPLSSPTRPTIQNSLCTI